MSENDHWNEPPIDPLADTNPSLTIQPVQPKDTAGWRRTVGLLSLLGAAGLTVATALLLIAPSDGTNVPPVATATSSDTVAITVMPTENIPPTAVVESGIVSDAVPTISPDVAASLLNQPLVSAFDGGSLQVERDIYNPFTIVPDRPRSEVIQYTALQGDTIYSIAERYSLKPESIAWSNTRRYVEVLRPGDIVNVPPIDGVYVQVVGSKTIAEITATYQITDPYVVIDSEYNDLFGVQPDTILPSGTWLFIPGGQGEQIVWNPGVVVEGGDSPRRGYVSVFAPGDPGSCGQVNNPGGGASWGFPLGSSYTLTQGYSAFHTGVDLSAAIGAPVLAANSGAVIFAGWNSWGYGYTVVLAHGPYLTLYGHLNDIYVRCGQIVSVGQTIGGVGNTGNSSGPHLHFEIRNGDVPSDPTATMPF